VGDKRVSAPLDRSAGGQPADSEAAGSETKSALQDRPQLLADMQRQIEAIRAALGKELLLPHAAPMEGAEHSGPSAADCPQQEPSQRPKLTQPYEVSVPGSGSQVLLLQSVTEYLEARKTSLHAAL
jgi:hypothetical protein